MRALVLAAGRGERLQPLTDLRPKSMLPLVGRPILHYIVDDIRLAGVTDMVFVVGYRKEMIQNYFKDGNAFGVAITYVEQRKPLGEADAILKAESEFAGEDEFILAHGDYVSEAGLVKRVVDAFCESGSDIAIALSRVENPSEYGVAALGENSRIERVVEKPSASAKLGNLAVSSVYAFTPAIFHVLRRIGHLEQGISHMIERGAKAAGIVWDREWMDIGRPWEVLRASRFLLSKVFSKTPRYISPSARLPPEARLEEPYHISDNVEIDHGAVVRGGCYLDSGCRIGTNALIRDYSYVGKNVIAGYSTEVKNSVILHDTSLGHIAYVGDSVIGSHCEIGAGVITSNFRFDEKPIEVNVGRKRYNSGLQKLGAMIGDHVKIGVNSSIYPGCKIGSNTWIGPSIVVTCDIPQNRFLSVDQKVKIRRQRSKVRPDLEL